MNIGESEEVETAVLGGGCFWCIEAVFRHTKGVIDVESGYSGGPKENSLYHQVATGETEHAEVVKVIFNPKIINFRELLYIFFTVHDPTTLDCQGSDVGHQYRSVIFYMDKEQGKTAYDVVGELEDQGAFKEPIVTEIVPYENFFVAEEEHQNFYEENKDNPYCQIIINPKLDKLKKKTKYFCE